MAREFSAGLASIENVHQGQIWASSSELQIILQAFTNAAHLHAVNYKRENLLTKGEQQVASLVA